ncbi:MAG: transposase [Nitrospiraceae bacterium]
MVHRGSGSRSGSCAFVYGVPPKYAVSKVVETLKSVTSRRLKEKFPHYLAKVYWDGGGIWA